MTRSRALPKREAPRVLVVEDDRDFAESLVELLAPLGFLAKSVGSAKEAIELLARFSADVALIDVKLGSTSGIQLIPKLTTARPSLVCILMTAYAAVDTAVDALRNGATDYLRKPLEPELLAQKLHAALELSEARLRKEREQRLMLMGQLCAGIAHDVNNCLQVMLTEVEKLDMTLGSTTPELADARASAHALDASLQSAAEVCRRILAFAKGAPASEGSEATAVLASTVSALERVLPAGIALRLDAPEVPVRVVLDASQLQQIVWNLVLNARHAIGEHGNVWIELETESLHDLTMARLRVVDDGSGIPEHVLPRIFDPYFSTKGASEGSGLGLSIIYGMVTAVGGEIRVESQLGRGTSFEVTIPIDTSAGHSQAVSSPKIPAQKLSKRVLIVDDTPAILSALQRAFRAAGYDCSCASSAEEALTQLDSEPAPPEGVISDVGLPKMSGIEFVEHVREKFPTLPVILLSGDTTRIQNLDRFGSQLAVLSKPFRPGALVQLFETLTKSPGVASKLE